MKIDEMQSRKTIKNVNKDKSLFFVMINEIDKTFNTHQKNK